MDHDVIILGELKEFKRATLHRLDCLERKVDTLRGFHWKVAGGMGLMVFLVEVGISIFWK